MDVDEYTAAFRAKNEAGVQQYLQVDAFNNRVYASKAITVGSDERLKMDVGPIDHGEELFDAITPKQYRMRADGPEGDLNFGCLAQDVKAAQEALGIPKTALLSAPADPEKMMGLAYEQFIALTMHKVKCMEARHMREIAALRAEIAAMKGGPS